jgi:hypothetical protein
MDDQYTEEPKEQPGDVPEEPVDIYSKRAIRGFSIIFSTVFGGVLLMINLWQVGYKKAAWGVLGFSVVYTLVASLLINSMKTPSSLMAIGINLIGGMILTEYFFPKYFPDNDYYPKPIWNALAVSILVTLTVFMIMYYTGNLPELNKALLKK